MAAVLVSSFPAFIAVSGIPTLISVSSIPATLTWYIGPVSLGDSYGFGFVDSSGNLLAP